VIIIPFCGMNDMILHLVIHNLLLPDGRNLLFHYNYDYSILIIKLVNNSNCGLCS